MYGKFAATQTVWLTNYPSIAKVYTFYVTILASKTPQITDQSYNINGEPFEFTIGEFGVLPDEFEKDEIVSSYLSAYLLGFGCQVELQVDIDSTCLQ